jgi:hypothetical protein
VGDERAPYELLTGDTPDISEYLLHDWYGLCWYYDSKDFPGERRLLGRWLGVAHRIGQAMCYWILPKSGIPIARTTVVPVSMDERATDEFKATQKLYDDAIAARLGDSVADDDAVLPNDHLPAWLDDTDDVDEPEEPEAAMPEADDYTPEAYDKWLEAEVLLPKGDCYATGKVVKRKRDDDGLPIGKAHNNPILDTRIYEVEFQDGHVEEYAANVIAECLFSQVDEEGRQYLLLSEIVDYRKDESRALSAEDAFVTSSNGGRLGVVC